MGSYKVKWIVCVSALVSCVLISSVASRAVEENPEENTKTGIEGLVAQLKKTLDSDVETLLKNYENKEEKIYNSTEQTVPAQPGSQEFETVGYTVGELAELCTMSIENCSYDRFKYVTSVGWVYRTAIPQLTEYANYCRYIKLRNLCLQEIEHVVENLSNNISQNDRDLIEPVRETLGEESIVERASMIASSSYKRLAASKQQAENDGEPKRKQPKEPVSSSDRIFRKQLGIDTRKAYSDYMKQKLGDKISLDQEKQFFANFKSAAKPYRDIYKLLLELYDKDFTGSSLMGEAIDLFKFGMVADRFCRFDGREITKALKKKEKEAKKAKEQEGDSEEESVREEEADEEDGERGQI